MADPIRPPVWPNLPAAPQRTDAKTAAQRAFFQQALNGAAVSTSSQEEPRRQAPRQPDLRIEIPDGPPQKILRPGSIIDIKV